MKTTDWVPERAKSVKVTTAGRRSGKRHTVTLWFVSRGASGPAYLWHNKGKSDWVANLKAGGEAEVDFGQGAVKVRATRVDGAEREGVIDSFHRRYLLARLFQLLGWSKQAIVFRLAEMR